MEMMDDKRRCFTAKNRIVLSLVGLFSVALIFVALALNLTEKVRSDGLIYLANPVTLLKDNAIAELAWGMGMPKVCCGAYGMATVILFAVYLSVCAFALVYESKFAASGGVASTARQTAIYALTVALSLIASIGLSLIIPLGEEEEYLAARYIFLAECIAVTIIVYGITCLAAALVGVLITNIVRRGKAANVCDSPLAPSAENRAPTYDRQKIFPALCAIDSAYSSVADDGEEPDCDERALTLKSLSSGFRNFLASRHKLYYDEDVIRLFLCAFGATRLTLLEGLSGTGKSSLPRYFAEYTGGRAVFVAVQSTWKDRADILGYFNDFTGTYNQTDFLSALYEANYDDDRLYVFVLDELNISRVEYYFADFLSVLEYPQDEQKLRIFQPPSGFIPPEKLQGGCLAIPSNCFFVGTANRDGSTFAISDKVYDRAVTISFENRNAPFAAADEYPVHLGAAKLKALFNEAEKNFSGAFSGEERAKFDAVCAYLYENFDVAFGNRIANQLEKLIPLFVACGGEADSLIDIVLSQKLAAKLEGRFEDYMRGGLMGLSRLIERTYGKGRLRRCERTVDRLVRRL